MRERERERERERREREREREREGERERETKKADKVDFMLSLLNKCKSDVNSRVQLAILTALTKDLDYLGFREVISSIQEDIT